MCAHCTVKYNENGIASKKSVLDWDLTPSTSIRDPVWMAHSKYGLQHLQTCASKAPCCMASQMHCKMYIM